MSYIEKLGNSQAIDWRTTSWISLYQRPLRQIPRDFKVRQVFGNNNTVSGCFILLPCLVVYSLYTLLYFLCVWRGGKHCINKTGWSWSSSELTYLDVLSFILLGLFQSLFSLLKPPLFCGWGRVVCNNSSIDFTWWNRSSKQLMLLYVHCRSNWSNV